MNINPVITLGLGNKPYDERVHEKVCSYIQSELRKDEEYFKNTGWNRVDHLPRNVSHG